ncbi:MAG: outer membrane homotrimeric porin [Desulfovibrio sp.]|nr:outer membrane homotrimeric porin [Desulfovibrio sp.]
MSSTNFVKRFKKQCMVALLAAGMLFGATTGAQAVDFKASGEWLVGFGLGDANFGEGGEKTDIFSAAQRFRVQLDAVASENLSGTLFFEIGTQEWGNNLDAKGGALGADGDRVIKVKNAYIDWIVPQTDLKLRMGLQALALPNFAGGSAIMDGDVAAISANYQFNDNVALTAFWMRPVNDNFLGSAKENGRDAHFLDNIDFFGLTLPLTFEGFEITPWAMYGIIGRNALDDINGWNGNYDASDGDLLHTLYAYIPGTDPINRTFGDRSRAYADAWFFGLPFNVTAFDPLNIEFDVNYGYVSGLGSTTVTNYKNWERFGVNNSDVRADSLRQGWLVKALVEYKMDWGVPGIFGWYSSGDDGDVKNGSERMPSIAGAGSFTSFMGCNGTDWWSDRVGVKGLFYENNMTYAGTWGVGLQIRDMSFLEDLTHTFRIAYWGGTNSTDMVKYVGAAGTAFDVSFDGPYLTTNDGLLEFNLDNSYQIYENLSVNLDLGYIVNMMDHDTWSRSWTKRGYTEGENFSKKDAWKAQLTFNYSF